MGSERETKTDMRWGDERREEGREGGREGRREE